MTSPGESEVSFDPAVAVSDHGAVRSLLDLEGAPDVPAEAREELLALKSGAVFVCARPDGDVPGRSTSTRCGSCDQRSTLPWPGSMSGEIATATGYSSTSRAL